MQGACTFVDPPLPPSTHPSNAPVGTRGGLGCFKVPTIGARPCRFEHDPPQTSSACHSVGLAGLEPNTPCLRTTPNNTEIREQPWQFAVNQRQLAANRPRGRLHTTKPGKKRP